MKLKQKWGDLPIMNKHAVVNKEKNTDIVAMTATFLKVEGHTIRLLFDTV